MVRIGRTRLGWPTAVVAAALWGNAGPVAASRCATSLISGGMKAACPSVDDPNLPACPPGATRVVYRLDLPFPPDGTHSTAVMQSTPISPCAGAHTTVPISDGYMIGCWTPPDGNGCRRGLFLSNGTLCLHFPAAPLGCGGPACENLSVEQVSISNAGAADHRVCPPVNAATSCRAQTGTGGSQAFLLWYGGLCSTMNLDGRGDTTNACISQWGATYWGYGKLRHQTNEQGWYDWATGAFKVSTTAGRPQCGALQACLGRDNNHRSQWQITLVAVPDDRIPGNKPPCLGNAQGLCQGATCFP